MATLLARRGVTDEASARRFLDPKLEDLEPPSAIPGLDRALERLALAHARGERVVIVGDYDVDGVSSTAILVASLRACGLAVESLLPDRLGEGYGFAPVHAERAAAAGATLIVTVDCGTTAYAAIDAARSRGLGLIVVDHHQPGEPLAESVILVNPLTMGSDAPGATLAAAGLALKVAVGLFERLGKVAPISALVRIAALGTIADMVPLLGENRVVASVGLRELGETKSLGLRALYQQAGINPRGGLESDDVGFRIAPRLNAAGRLGSADPALELLLTRDPAVARQLAAQLEEINHQRQAQQALVIDEACRRVAALGAELPPILVEWDATWHRGVVGIAAGRLSRQFHRPTILLGVEDGIATGSGRSVPGIHLHEFLEQSGGRLLRFGGHAQAIGLSAEVESLEDLRRAWIEAAAVAWPAELLQPRHYYDAEVDPAIVTVEFVRSLFQLRPHGVGNPRPVVRIGPLQLTHPPRPFGKADPKLHLEAFARPSGRSSPVLSLLGWQWANRAADLAGDFEVLGDVQLDRDGRPQVVLLDARPAC